LFFSSYLLPLRTFTFLSPCHSSFVFLLLYWSCSLSSHLLGYVKSDPVITTSVCATPRL
jgi:hypothetical protein